MINHITHTLKAPTTKNNLPKMKDNKTVEEINQEFQDFQDDLLIRKKHLKLPSSFDTSSMDDLIELLDLPTKKLPCKKR